MIISKYPEESQESENPLTESQKLESITRNAVREQQLKEIHLHLEQNVARIDNNINQLSSQLEYASKKLEDIHELEFDSEADQDAVLHSTMLVLEEIAFKYKGFAEDITECEYGDVLLLDAILKVTLELKKKDLGEKSRCSNCNIFGATSEDHYNKHAKYIDMLRGNGISIDQILINSF